MPLAARVSDLTNHPGAIGGPGSPNVAIEKLAAARAGDVHACAQAPSAHPPNTIASGSATVRINGQPAARKGDLCSCGAVIATSAFTVSIG